MASAAGMLTSALLLPLLTCAALTSAGAPGEVSQFRPPPDELDSLLDSSLLDDIERQLSREAGHGSSNSTALLSRSRRALAFPTGSYAQLDFELYVPFYRAGDFTAILDWTTTFRLNLPNSTSSISIGRSLDDDRERIYNIIEAMMYSFGVDGRVCLLRTICDVAEQPFKDDGVLGDVINTVMAASYRWQDDKMYEYVEAEYYGRYYGNCQDAYNCPFSMSRIAEVMTDVVG